MNVTTVGELAPQVFMLMRQAAMGHTKQEQGAQPALVIAVAFADVALEPYGPL